MVKFVWVKFINVRLVNRKHKPCMLTGTAHSLHAEGKKNGMLFSFIMPCLCEALIFTLGSFLLPLFLSPLYMMLVYWIIFIKCSALKLIWRKEEVSQELFGSLCFASQSCNSSVTNFHSHLMNGHGCLKTATKSEAGQSLLSFAAA